jgi:predicted ATPase
LFVGRARLNDESFEFDDEDAPFVCEICRKLDGMALAIELAAGRVGSSGHGCSPRIWTIASCF